MDDCLFCRIAAKKIPASVVYEDDEMLAFDDIHPQAPVHVLVIPKEHFASLNDVPEGREGLLGRMSRRDLAEAKGIAESGYAWFSTRPGPVRTSSYHSTCSAGEDGLAAGMT
jgi:histidine triad (HIT) family protein